MSKIIEASAEIARTPQEVFDFVSDAARLPDWQPSVEAAGVEPPGTRAVGLRGHEVRRLPSGRRTIRWQVTDCEPGRRWGVAGIEGPVRAHAALALTPTSGGAGTRVDYRIWFEGHGIGKLLRLLAQQGASKEAPESLSLLKRQLESGGEPADQPQD